MISNQWEIATHSKLAVSAYVSRAQISPLLAGVFAKRGWSIDQVQKWNAAPRQLLAAAPLTNLTLAAETIWRHAKNPNSEIWIYADYDADGLTSGAMLTKALRSFAACKVWPYFPQREEKYGISLDFCRSVSALREGKPLLVITVDNGVSAVDEIRQLVNDGADVVILDHHMPQPILPPGIIVDPHVFGDAPDYLAGCGVVWRTLLQLESMEKSVCPEEYLYAACIGSIGDVMRMEPENQAMVKLGIQQLNSHVAPKPFRAWKKFLGISAFSPADIAWEIAPRLNACGRMGDIMKAAELLFFENEDQDQEIKDCILEIEEINAQRKSLTKKAEAAADKMNFAEDSLIVFDASEFPPGISGIIAGKLAEKHGKPAVVLHGEEILSGSCRVPGGYDFATILKQEIQTGNLLHFGGHDAACGVLIERDKLLDFHGSVNEKLRAAGAKCKTEDKLDIDGVIGLDDINEAVHRELSQLAYDNESFREPMFALQNLRVENITSSKANPQNIKLQVSDGQGRRTSLWAWKFGDHYKNIGAPDRIHLAGSVVRDFIDNRKITLRVEDILPA